jgi:multidrug resistance efflux pump
VLWFVLAAWLEMPGTVSSVDGRIVSGFRQTRIVSSTTAPIADLRVDLGDRVAPGDILVRFDSRLLELDLASAEQTLAKLNRQLQHVRDRAMFSRQQHEAELSAASKELDTAQARVERIQTKIRFSTSAERIYGEMRRDRQIDELRYLESLSVLETDRFELDALMTEKEVVKERRSAAIYAWNASEARFRQEESEVLGAIAELEPRLAQLRRQIEELTVVASDVGIVEGIAQLSVGQNVPPSDWLMTISPGDEFHFEASFSASKAAGRIRVNSPASISFDALPWTRYGTLSATVERVGNEEISGRILVYLSLSETSDFAGDVRHGLKGMAVVRIDEATLFERLLSSLR